MKIFSKKMWIIFTSIVAIFLVLFITASVIMNKYEAAINSYFDLVAYKKVEIKEDENIDKNYYKSSYDSDEDLWYETSDFSEQVAGEGSVLLWNNSDALPLQKASAVSLFSITSVDLIYCGTGSAAFDTTGAPTLKNALEDNRFKVNPVLWDWYLTGGGKNYRRTKLSSIAAASNTNLYMNEAPWNKVESACGTSFEEYSDAAIVVIGRGGGEESDLCWGTNGNTDGLGNNYLQLTQEEVDMLDALTSSSSKFKKVIVLINSANPLQMDKLASYKEKIGACLWIGNPGYAGIGGVAEILAGTVNPSGRLVDTYCYDNKTNPSMANMGDYAYGNYSAFGKYTNNGQNDYIKYIVYQEGIYTGYRYYETRYEDVVTGKGNAGNYDYASTVIYPFGYGNSYTTFEYSDYQVRKNSDGDYEVTVTVTNTGAIKGKEVVQVYIQRPYTDFDKQNGLEKPSVELAGFAKTKTLKPGKYQTITITVDKEALRTYDDEVNKTYILESGKYYLALGSDAHDALNNILAGKAKDGVTVNSSAMTAEGNTAFVTMIEDVKTTDLTIFAKDEVTGTDISNKFEFADINKYEGTSEQKITYLTRSDWQGTYPESKVNLTMNETIAKDITYNKAIAEDSSITMPTFGANNGLTLIAMMGKDYDDKAWNEVLDQMTFEEMAELVAVGYCQTVAVKSINKPQTKESDGALGIGSSYARLTPYKTMGWPCEIIAAATWNVQLIEEMGELYGEDMFHSGVQGIYSPGLNVHRNSYCGRNFEYYSEDPYITGQMASAQVKGIQSKGNYVFMKHFALNEVETNRHGVSVWANEQTIRELYLDGFETAVKSGATGLMSSYNRIGCLWTGGSKALMADVLRGEWGFKGQVITDYGAYVNGIYSYTDGLMAGVDKYFSSGETFDYKEYRNNATVCNALRQAVHRILYVTVNTHAMNGMTANTKIVPILTWWQKCLIAGDIAFGCVTIGGAVMIVLSALRKKKAVAV